MQSPMFHQITFEEIISGRIKAPPIISSNESNTRTRYVVQLPQRFLDQYDIDGMVRALEAFCNDNRELYEKNRRTLYDTFHIPKRSGGLREINAPKTELMEALRNLKTLLETKMFALYHTSAFAYVPKRSTIDSIRKHQSNGSYWFLKTDFSDFFGRTTLDFLMNMLSMIFPFSEIVKREDGRAYLKRALELCFLNGGLPQGTPISPMLTNLMMIPIDHRLYNCLRDFRGHPYVYTRYADDILISSRAEFDHNDIISFINETLVEFKAPFSIKDEKTTYGSRAGSNWHLGVVLNKDNQITIGFKNKQRLRAMVSNYILDRKNGVDWDLHDIQILAGKINYYRMVEPEYVKSVIEYNNDKYKVDVEQMMHKDLGA